MSIWRRAHGITLPHLCICNPPEASNLQRAGSDCHGLPYVTIMIVGSGYKSLCYIENIGSLQQCWFPVVDVMDPYVACKGPWLDMCALGPPEQELRPPMAAGA